MDGADTYALASVLVGTPTDDGNIKTIPFYFSIDD